MKFLKSESFAPRLEVVIAVLLASPGTDRLGALAVLSVRRQPGLLLCRGHGDGRRRQLPVQRGRPAAYAGHGDLEQDHRPSHRARIPYDSGNEADIERYEWKLDQVMADNVYDEFSAAIDWADAQTEYASPFEMEGYVDSYYTDAAAMYNEGTRRSPRATSTTTTATCSASSPLSSRSYCSCSASQTPSRTTRRSSSSRSFRSPLSSGASSS